MIKKLLLAAAAVATLTTGTIAGSSNADAGLNVTISGPGFGHGSHRYAPRHRHGHRHGRGYGYRSSSYWGGHRHHYGSYRPHCRWRMKKVKVRTWDAYNNSWATRKVRRRYRTCY